MSRSISVLFFLYMAACSAIGRAEYVDLWTFDTGTAGAVFFCDSGNTDDDPALELLIASDTNNAQQLRWLYLVDGATGTLEWSANLGMINTGVIGTSSSAPWTGAPQLLDIDADGRDEIVVALNGLGVQTFDLSSASATSYEPSGDSISPLQINAGAPNPFNSDTRISVVVSRDLDIRASIVDVRGRLVRHVFEGMLRAGEHAFVWDGKDDSAAAAASGTYFWRIWSGGLIESRPVVLVK